MCFLWFRYDFDMILIWFWYAKDYDFLMVLESLRFFDMILIRFSYGFGVSPFFWYDFDMIFLWFWSLSVFLIWFSYGFGVSPFSWYDFLMVLGCLRLFDMISLLFSSGHISHPRRRIPATPPTPPRRTPATPPTPVAGLQPHLPPPSPDPGHTSHARRLWFQTLVSFWFFWISMDVAACYRPTELSLNISFTILWVRLARRGGFQCCC